MALIYQYGFGILPFGMEGFGGLAEQYAEMTFIANDAPCIAYRNVLNLPGSTFQTVVGTQLKGAMADNNLLDPALCMPQPGIDFVTNNFIRFSEQLDHPYWAAGRSSFMTVIPNDDGVADKVSVQLWPGNAAQSIAAETIDLPALPRPTFTVDIRPGVGRYVQVCVYCFSTVGSPILARINFDLIAKISILIQVTGTTLLASSVTDLGTGYLRCSITLDNPNLAALTYRPIQFCDAAGYELGDTTGMYHWIKNIQCSSENVTAPLIYVPSQDVWVQDYRSFNYTNSVLSFVWTAPSRVYRYGFGVQPFGNIGMGGYDALPELVNCLIFGAARHDVVGLRSVPSRFRIVAESGCGDGGFGWGGFGGSVLDKMDNSPANASLIAQFQPVNAVRVTVTLWGLPATSVIPELFLGNALKLPFLELGFDPYHEVSTGQNFLAESGREYPQLRYRKMELSPKWSYVEKTLWADVAGLIEAALELKNPVWFAWSPASKPLETYLMRNNAKSAPFPYVNAMYRSWSLQLVEVL